MLLVAHAGTFDSRWISCNQKLLHHGPGNEVQKTEKKHGRIKGPRQYVSETWPRAGLGEPRSASNADKLPSS